MLTQQQGLLRRCTGPVAAPVRLARTTSRYRSRWSRTPQQLLMQQQGRLAAVGHAAAEVDSSHTRASAGVGGGGLSSCSSLRGQQQQQRCVAARAAMTSDGAADLPHHHDLDPPDTKLASWFKLARIHNMVPSMLLVVVGAWAGGGHSLSAVQRWSVWVMSLVSAGIAVASMCVNDYFDLKLDATNAPDKPLPSGAIAPDAALLASSLLYCACLIVACLMEPSRLRSIVAFSTAATLLYTPLFKRLTAVKNATVATVIALAPVTGALAAGAGDAGLLRLAPATLFAFAGVMFREILMDMNDAEGDRASGIWTLPVLLGKPAALASALLCLLAGSAAALARLMAAAAAAGGGPAAGGCSVTVGVSALLSDAAASWPLLQQALVAGGVAWSPAWQTAVVAGLPGLVLLVAVSRLAVLARHVWAHHYSHEAVSRAVDECLKPLGLTIILLAALS